MSLKTAVVGVGYLGRFHAQKHKALEKELDFQLAGVYDASPERSKFIADELGVPSFKNLEEVAASAQAVTVASATVKHFELTKFFLERGLHVNVEKPMTNDVSQARELNELAIERDLVLAVGHSERFSPVYSQLKKEFTQPEFLEFRRHAPFKLRGSDVSVILDLMIHDIDLCLNWGDSVKSISSARAGRVVSETFDWAKAILNMSSGRTVVLSASRLAAEMTRSVRGYEKRVAFRGDFQNSKIEISEWNLGQEEPIRLEDKLVPKLDHLLLETKQFIQTVQGRGRLETTAPQGLAAVQLAIEIEKRAVAS